MRKLVLYYGNTENNISLVILENGHENGWNYIESSENLRGRVFLIGNIFVFVDGGKTVHNFTYLSRIY